MPLNVYSPAALRTATRADERPAEILPRAVQIEPRAVVHDADGARAVQRCAPRGDADFDAIRRHHAIRIRAFEQSVECARLQARRRQAARARRNLGVAMHRKRARDAAERAAAAPRAQIEIMHLPLPDQFQPSEVLAPCPLKSARKGEVKFA